MKKQILYSALVITGIIMSYNGCTNKPGPAPMNLTKTPAQPVGPSTNKPVIQAGEQPKDNPDELMQKGVAAIESGNYPTALDCFQQVLKLVPDDGLQGPTANYDIACTYALMKQSQPALEYLAKAIKLGYDDRAAIEADTDLVSLRELPEYQALIKSIVRVQLPGYINSDGVKTDYTVAPLPVELSLTAAISYQADPDTVKKVKDSFEVFGQLLWQDTFGQMCIKKVLLRNNSRDGYIHFEKLSQLGGHATFGGPFTVSTNLFDLDKTSGRPGLGVKVLGAGILHEFGHSMFWLKDEYGTTRQCIMHPQSRTTTFCVSCEQELLERYKTWKFPPEAERAGWPAAHSKPAMTIQEE